MAAVYLSQMPVTPSKSTTTRRAPLASNPNAVNSPCRTPGPPAAGKQKRPFAVLQKEDPLAHYVHPSKRQTLDGHVIARTSIRQLPDGGQRGVSRLDPLATTTTTIRERSTQQQQMQKFQATPEELKAWRKHYRKIFPKFVFYFESITEDVKAKYMKYAHALGAREERFFSNAVTHVITTRPIPPEDKKASTSPTNDGPFSQNAALQTINPSLLQTDSARYNLLGSRTRHALDAPNGRKVAGVLDVETRRPQTRNADVLHRARDLGMKIWALEKLQRMLQTILNVDADGQASHGHNTRGHALHVAAVETTVQPNLSQLLKHEKIHGPSDRDPTVAAKDLALFRGPYIYVRDIDEKQRPIMVREYPQPAQKSEGEWPQFRSVAGGKCPFIDDAHRERAREEGQRLARNEVKKDEEAPRTRAATNDAARMRPPRGAKDMHVLAEMENVNRIAQNQSAQVANEEAPTSFHRRQTSDLSSRGQNAFISRAGPGRLFAGEPVASGLQQSAITSAIRSQMISSTAAQPGARAGTNKEMHGLQRKVLEKNSNTPTSHSLTVTHRRLERREVQDDRSLRQSTSKLEQIDETCTVVERSTRSVRGKQEVDTQEEEQPRRIKMDAKPGYCENCQDKFEDFDEHVISRKHRKFADDAQNWRELDDLLAHLGRQLKEEHR